jgi:hypothetical protein
MVIGTNLHNFVQGGGCGARYTEDPLLGPLEENGGETETHALLPDSPAIDLIPEGYCTVMVDQRGEPRAAIDRESLLCGLGAYEWQP